MTKQLQVSVPTIPAEVSMIIGVFSVQVTEQVRQITRQIADSTGNKQSAVELELYTLTLCSCVYGLICEAADDDTITLQPGQSARIQEKLKQLAINLIVNELQDQVPHPSEN
jgi:hypothetical protein